MQSPWAVVGILLGALGIRLIAINDYGLWTDEALTIVLSHWSFLDMIRYPIDPTPPLYYALHAALVGSDATAGQIRAVSVAAGVSAVLAMYALGRLCFGRLGGLLAAALLAVWTSHVEYSQEARAYALLFLLTLVASVGVVLFAKNTRGGTVARRRLGLVLFALGNVLSFYTHVVSALWIALTSLIVLGAVLGDRRRGALLEVIAAFALMAVLAVPALRWLYLSTVNGPAFAWLKQADLARFIGEFANTFLPSGLWSNDFAERFGGQYRAKGIVLVIWAACIGIGLFLARRSLIACLRERPYAAAVTGAYLSLPLLIWGIGWVATPILMERTILFAIPGMILLLTGLCLAGSRTWTMLFGGGLIALYGVSSLANDVDKQDWRGAARFLAANAAPGDLIAVCPAWNYPAIRHAATPTGTQVVAFLPDGRLVQMEAGLGSDRAWDRNYHLHYAQPAFRQKYGAASADAIPVAERSQALVQPGRSIWRLDGHCYGRADQAASAALAPVDANPRTVWQEAGEAGASRLTVTRYLASTPASFIVERPRDPE